MPTQRHIITLTEVREARLLAIASQFTALATSGPYSGKPSFRALLNAIADGELRVVPTIKEGRLAKKKFKASVKHPPKWWKPSEDSDMPVAAVVAASGYTQAELEAGGLIAVMGGGEACFMAPSDWTAWHERK